MAEGGGKGKAKGNGKDVMSVLLLHETEKFRGQRGKIQVVAAHGKETMHSSRTSGLCIGTLYGRCQD